MERSIHECRAAKGAFSARHVALADPTLGALDAQFDAMYSHEGRPSVPPEQLLKETVLTALYSGQEIPRKPHQSKRTKMKAKDQSQSAVGKSPEAEFFNGLLGL